VRTKEVALYLANAPISYTQKNGVASRVARFREGNIMVNESYGFAIEAAEQAAAGRSAIALADTLREVDGVLEAVHGKADTHTMDLGAVVSVLATSGATLAIARGLAAWLRARRGVTVTVERDNRSGSIKAAIEGLDPEAAVRIVEIVREG
jgi:hypothetical protein